ncbi:MAG: M56 family metallopeptidase [Bacteroidales bacterium]|nr:M56 family metallopeptidase [Bacteroidales bacterium]
MEPVYCFQVALTLTVVFISYKLFLSKDSFHARNRAAILSAVTLSFVLPLVKLPDFLTFETESEISETVIELGAVIVNGNFVNNISYTDVLTYIILIGASVFFLRLIISTAAIIVKAARNRKIEIEKGTDLIVSESVKSPISWLKYIFINSNDYHNNPREILTHEMAHIHYHHTIDLIFIDLLCCLQWFNPVIWLFRRELRSVHEFQADAAVVNSGINAKNYQILLIKKAAGRNWSSVVSSLNHSNLKKRIAMMSSKKSSKSAAFKVLLPIAVTACLAVTFANCNNSMLLSNDDKVNEKSFTNQDEPYVIVEEMPEFPGGDKALLMYIAENVKYPEEAKNKDIEGTVYLKFVVNAEGKVQDVNILRSVDPILDQEAVKVVENLPEWTPGHQGGKPVNVSMQIPIMFKLAESNPSADN